MSHETTTTASQQFTVIAWIGRRPDGYMLPLAAVWSADTDEKTVERAHAAAQEMLFGRVEVSARALEEIRRDLWNAFTFDRSEILA